MKQLLLAGLAIMALSCAKENKPSPTTLSGTISGSEVQKVVVFGNGFDQELTVTDGQFADTLDIPKADYYRLRIGREGTGIYLEPGAQIALTVNTEEFDETISYSGEKAAPSNYLAAKYLISESLMDFETVYASGEPEFLAQNQKYTDACVALLKETKGLDQDFYSKEAKEIEYAHFGRMENYQEYHRYLGKTPESKSFKVSANFYDALSGIDFADTATYRTSQNYKGLVGAHFSRLKEDILDADPEAHDALAYIQVVDQGLPDGNAKDQMLASYLQFGLKPDARLEEVATAFLATSPSEENLATFTERYELYKTIVPGKDSPNFEYENHAGGSTSLADLEGKYVYIDIWATWCGPCIREIPSLKALEADYHDKNIEFVSISIDEMKDHEKWQNMVTARELGGIQLFADNNWSSDFVVGYGIKGIPRFIMLGPDGTIVNADAPRPSNPDVRELFDKLI